MVTVDVEVLPTTTADRLEATVDTPAAVIAVTSTRRRWSTSAVRTPYVRPAVPLMLRQPSPLASQRCQMRRNNVGVGVHVPFFTLSSSPTRADPEIAGRTVFFGPSFESTTSVGSEVAVPFPSVFVAVTSTRSVCDTSPATTVYAAFVAPADVAARRSVGRAALPLVGEHRRVARPCAVPGRELASLSCRAADFRWVRVRRSRRRPPVRGGAYHARSDAHRRQSDSATPSNPPQIHSSLLPSWSSQIASR